MHSDMSVEVGPAQEKLKARIGGQEDLDFYQGGTDKFIFGNALFRNLGAGKFEEVSDRMGVETYWPWGTKRRRPERGRLAGRFHHRLDELSIPLRDQFALIEQSRREVSRQ